MEFTHHSGSLKEALIFQASSWKSFTPRIPTNTCHKLGELTLHPFHLTHFSQSFARGSWERLLPLSSLCMVASSHRKYLRSSPRFGEDPRSRSSEPVHILVLLPDVVPGSKKVTHQWEPVGLSGGNWGYWLSSGGALWLLQPCPQDLLLYWSQLGEQWWTSSHILLVDQLSLSICSSSVAAATKACQ